MKQFLLNLIAKYLKWCAKRVVSRFTADTLVIGITGSTGKTSTKEAIGLLIKQKYPDAVVSSGNLNNEIGLPLAILQFSYVPIMWQMLYVKFQALWRAFLLKPKQAYVLEYAIDHPGDMKYLLDIVKPQVAVITNVTSVHLEFFNSQEEIAKEKFALAQSVDESGMVIRNGDDNYLNSFVKKNGNIIKFGSGAGNDLVLTSYKITPAGTTFDVSWHDKKESHTISALGRQHVLSVLPAIAICKKNGWDDSIIDTMINQYKVLPGRGNIVQGKEGSIIINDTYNANPLSVMEALNVVNEYPAKYKIVVLGDMLELGNASQEEHKKVINQATRIADKVITVGPRMQDAGGGNQSFNNPMAAAKYLSDAIKPNSLILIKGSQGLRMELATEAIMANPQEAATLLPRQTLSWKKKKWIPE